LILEPNAVVYVKTRAVDGPLDVAGADALGYFLLAVEDVLEDAAAEWEEGMRLTGAVTYAPAPALDAAWARATLAALAAPRARACVTSSSATPSERPCPWASGPRRASAPYRARSSPRPRSRGPPASARAARACRPASTTPRAAGRGGSRAASRPP